jgi:hypothetical protein
MLANQRIIGRMIGAIAGAAALSLAVATTASAHHCYKEDWNDAAYAHVSQGGTAWLPLGDLGRMVVSEELGLPQCAYVIDGVVADYVAIKGLDAEPLIHSRATAGGGAAHQGKTVPPYEYLDFAVLDPLLQAAVGDCLGA